LVGIAPVSLHMVSCILQQCGNQTNQETTTWHIASARNAEEACATQVTLQSPPEAILSAFKESNYWNDLNPEQRTQAAGNPVGWLTMHPHLFSRYMRFFRAPSRMSLTVLQVYSCRVFADRKHRAFKDAVFKGIARIMAWLMNSEWTIHQAIQAQPRALQIVAQKRYPSRVLTFWGVKPKEDEQLITRWEHVKLIETTFTPPFHEPPRYPTFRFSKRFPFIHIFCPMACRSLCGHPLLRVHNTCWIHCGLRRAYYGLMPKTRMLQAVWTISPDSQRKNRRVTEVFAKKFALLLEWSATA